MRIGNINMNFNIDVAEINKHPGRYLATTLLAAFLVPLGVKAADKVWAASFPDGKAATAIQVSSTTPSCIERVSFEERFTGRQRFTSTPPAPWWPSSDAYQVHPH
jgi:hypothetical protein